MADFCLKCFNQINDSHYSKFDVIEEWGICEECGEHTNVVVDFRCFGLLNFFFWLGNRISIRASMFYDDYLFEIDKKLRFRYTREQKKAMSGKIPMTEELFWGCMNVTHCRLDNVKLRWLLKTYPQFMKKFSDDYDRRYRDDPVFREEQDKEWQRVRSLLVDDFGEDYVREHFTD